MATEFHRRHTEDSVRPDLSAADEIFNFFDTNESIDNLLETAGDLQQAKMPEGRVYKTRELKAKFRHISRRDTAAEFMSEIGIPEPGEITHIISNSQFDFFSLIVAIVNELEPIPEFYGSTWTMSKFNVDDLLKLINEGKLKKVSILTGTYFKARENAVYATLITGLTKHKMRYNAFINHTKIILMKDTQGNHIVVEGSANFTHNPRLENFIICNNQELYEFHQEWMEEMLDRDSKYKTN